MEIWLLWTVIRLVVPFTILRWPFFGTLLSAYIDVIAYFYLPLTTEDDFAAYQVWDKILDTYYLGFAAYTSLSWRDTIAKRISVFSFFYRAFGVVLFVIFQMQPLLFFFPNFFENFFLFYLLYTKLANTHELFPTVRSTSIIVIAILVPKLLQEYFLHVIETVPTDEFDIPAPEMIQWAVFLAAYLALPVAVLFWRVIRVKRYNKND